MLFGCRAARRKTHWKNSSTHGTARSVCTAAMQRSSSIPAVLPSGRIHTPTRGLAPASRPCEPGTASPTFASAALTLANAPPGSVSASRVIARDKAGKPRDWRLRQRFEIVLQSSLAAVIDNLDVGDAQIREQGVEETHFVLAFAEKQFRFGKGDRGDGHQRTSRLISIEVFKVFWLYTATRIPLSIRSRRNSRRS